jgi:hypothetical protein
VGENSPRRCRPLGTPEPQVGSLGSVLLAEESFTPFLGDDLIVYLVLALGGALVAGNLAAILRPPQADTRSEGSLDQAPVTRSLIMAGVGLVAALWAIASLLKG